MAYNEALARRLRERLEHHHDITEKAMFGGLSFLLYGHLCCGVIGEDMIVRVGPDGHAAAMDKPFVRVFDFSGKPMKGWVVVAPQGLDSDKDLQDWVEQGVSFAATLPAK